MISISIVFVSQIVQENPVCIPAHLSYQYLLLCNITRNEIDLRFANMVSCVPAGESYAIFLDVFFQKDIKSYITLRGYRVMDLL